MRVDAVKAVLEEFGVLEGYREFATSSATVDLAAKAAGCEAGRIAKSLTFLTASGPILVLVMGTARIENRKFKLVFHEKARFVAGDQVEELIGHPVGGVCPFALNQGVKVYLDESLRAFDPVYPAAGAPNNAVCISLADLERITSVTNPVGDGSAWINICKVSESSPKD